MKTTVSVFKDLRMPDHGSLITDQFCRCGPYLLSAYVSSAWSALTPSLLCYLTSSFPSAPPLSFLLPSELMWSLALGQPLTYSEQQVCLLISQPDSWASETAMGMENSTGAQEDLGSSSPSWAGPSWSQRYPGLHLTMAEGWREGDGPHAWSHIKREEMSPEAWEQT